MIVPLSSLLLLSNSVITQGFDDKMREMNQTVGNMSTNNTNRRNSLHPLWITLGVFLFIVLLFIILIAVLLYLRKKHKVRNNKITAFCPCIRELLPSRSQNTATKRLVTKAENKSYSEQLEKLLHEIKTKPEGKIKEHISVLTDIISMNCNVDYAAKARENNAVKILYDVLVKNNAKEILESTIVCLTKLMEGSDEFKKIAKDTGTLKIFDDFLYKYNNDADLSLKMFNFLQLFVDSPDLPKEALLQSGIVQTILNYSLEKEQDKTWESTLSCLSGLSESITTDENKLIEKLFKRFIKYNTVIEEEKNQRLIYLSVKIIYDLTKNIERNKELFNELTNLSNGSPSRELIAKIIRNCILDSKPRLDLFAVTFEQEKMFWPEFTKSVKELNNLVISLNCLWIATKLIIENESSRWEIIGKTFTACRILDNDVLAQFSVGIGETIRSVTKNNRFDTDHKMRENVEEFITTSGMSGLSKIIVEWSETKKEMLAKPEHRKENSLIEYWR